LRNSVRPQVVQHPQVVRAVVEALEEHRGVVRLVASVVEHVLRHQLDRQAHGVGAAADQLDEARLGLAR
jgi:hypothetical protein